VTDPTPAPALALPASLLALVRDGVLDAELGALLWLTVEGGIPTVVAGGAGEQRRAVRDALLALVGTMPIVHLAGADEDFAWMPQAGELGWRSSGPALPGRPGAVMVAALEPGDAGTWGEAAHLAIRALTSGYSLVATAGGSTLDDVLSRLSLPPVSAIDDELARLGVVLLLDDGPRVRIAHYLRPAARDPGGHVQRPAPAALATWNGKTARYDHFAWGVVAELAGRIGQRPISFEREQARRAAAISSAAAGA
jgi:hypothetical protein